MTTSFSEHDQTLRTAVARYEDLRLRDSLVDPDDPDGPSPLDRDEALELLALGEVIAQKAVTGRQLTIRSARWAGASWAQIGRALGTSRQSAWESHQRWIDAQVGRRDVERGLGFDAVDAAAARELAGNPDEEEDRT